MKLLSNNYYYVIDKESEYVFYITETSIKGKIGFGKIFYNIVGDSDKSSIALFSRWLNIKHITKEKNPEYFL
jgi:hypothetical protein